MQFLATFVRLSFLLRVTGHTQCLCAYGVHVVENTPSYVKWDKFDFLNHLSTWLSKPMLQYHTKFVSYLK